LRVPCDNCQDGEAQAVDTLQLVEGFMGVEDFVADYVQYGLDVARGSQRMVSERDYWRSCH
jgi:hypothetical protein